MEWKHQKDEVWFGYITNSYLFYLFHQRVHPILFVSILDIWSSILLARPYISGNSLPSNFASFYNLQYTKLILFRSHMLVYYRRMSWMVQLVYHSELSLDCFQMAFPALPKFWGNDALCRLAYLFRELY